MLFVGLVCLVVGAFGGLMFAGLMASAKQRDDMEVALDLQ